MFQGQSDLEDQGQGHQVSNSSETFTRSLYAIKTRFKFEGKIPKDSKVIMFTRNHTDKDDADGTKIICLPQSGVGGGHNDLGKQILATKIYLTIY